jgi:predicted  nucleic acid-binding Zn-ribbon protein
LKDQLVSLQELQTVDAQIQEQRSSIQALPAKLAPAKQDLAKLEAMLQIEKSKLAETEAWRAEQEEMISREETAVKDAKAKLQQAKNSRDFAAASREVDNKRRNISEREEEVLKVIEALETSKTNLEAHEKDVDALRSTVEAEEKSIGEKVTELEAGLSGVLAEREALAAKVPPPLLKRYEMIKNRRGLAVVPVKEGVCQGCHMSLPPQLNNILARFESVENCPNCQRLLYRIELLEQATEQDSE